MLIDEVNIQVKGGDGGNGIASFRNTKMNLGPTGGDGGNGGDVYVIGVSDLSALRQFRHKKRFTAQDGGNGSHHNHAGRNGEDLVLPVPVGTVVRNLELRQVREITRVGQKEIIAHGATGGHGNYYFRSSINVTPQEFEPGIKAREFSVIFELKLIADVGFVGLPNAGKSSLLNELTRANSKVANYHFTTLEPNLGAYYDLILADIPGLIEGASQGRGLGVKFLKHISRCRVLFHLVPGDSEDVVRDYHVIREELGKYDKALLKKPEYLFLSKTDLIDAKTKAEKIKHLKKLNPSIRGISVYEWESLEQVKSILNKIAKEKVS